MAGTNVPSFDETRHKSRTSTSIRDLADELRDRVGEAAALIDAVSSILATTAPTAESLARLRHVVLSAQGAATTAVGLAHDLTLALRGVES
jgi:hypothetical protein